MELVSAVCPNCGGVVDVDGSATRGVCSFCGSPFLIKDAVNQYNIKGDSPFSSANIIRNALAYLYDFSDFSAAEKEFARMTKHYAADFRGWLGLAVAASKSFCQQSGANVSSVQSQVAVWLTNAEKIAPEEVKSVLSPICEKLAEKTYYSETDIVDAENRRDILAGQRILKRNKVQKESKISRRIVLPVLKAIGIWMIFPGTVVMPIIRNGAESFEGMSTPEYVITVLIRLAVICGTLALPIYFFIHRQKKRIFELQVQFADKENQLRQMDHIVNKMELSCRDDSILKEIAKIERSFFD